MLVDPSDGDALMQAITLNTFLWGGTYNPIIPVFQQVPGNWSHFPLPPVTRDEIYSGYVRFFDPDILVVCGEIDKATIPASGRSVIIAKDITDPISDRGLLGYGLGLNEIIAGLAQEEFRFVRRDNLKVFVPTITEPQNHFLAAICGGVPPEFPAETFERYLDLVDTHRPDISMTNYVDYTSGHYLFRRKLCSFKLEALRYRTERQSAIFYFDHDNTLDIIDFWNLRAIGWEVMPMPRAVGCSPNAVAAARKFIKDYEGKDEENPHYHHRVTIIKARSLNEPEHQAFVESLREQPSQIMTCQFWYPRMWDEFTHSRGHLSCSQLVAGTRTVEIRDEDVSSRLGTLAPSFMADGYRSGPSFANDIAIQRYGLKEFRTEVIPPDHETVAGLFGLGASEEWRVGANGLTFLAHHADFAAFLNHPGPNAVVSSVLATMKWNEFNISPAGHVAYQMMRHLGGPLGIGLLKRRRLIEYLEKLSRVGNYALSQAFFAEMKQIESSPAAGAVHWRVKQYTDAKVFTLGLEVQCAVCTQRSWYPLNGADYDVQCPKCLSKFPLPQHNPSGELKWAYKNIGPFASPPDADGDDTPEVQWAYKSTGPFAAPKRGGGAYSVLLVVSFLHRWLNPTTTTTLSFKAKREDGKALEADFMMFYRNTAFWQRRMEWVFGECKTFNRLKKQDIDRMQVIADHFPDSILIFATLSDDFSKEEKQLLIPFVRACRSYGKLDRPRNGVLLLTGSELFSHIGPPSCWREKDGIAKDMADKHRPFSSLLELCDASQMIYLGLDSWSADWQAEFARRREEDEESRAADA